MYTRFGAGLVAVVLVVSVLVIPPVDAATAVQTVNVMTQEGVGNCVATQSIFFGVGYAGSGSMAYTVPSDGQYFIGDTTAVHQFGPVDPYSGYWAIVPTTYDPSVPFQTQAFAYGFADDPATPAELTAGQDVLILFVGSGSYNALPLCEAQSFWVDVTATIYREDSTGTDPVSPIPGPDMVAMPEGAVVGAFTADTPLYYAPKPDATTSYTMTAGKTLWVTGMDASGRFYQVVLAGQFLWVPVDTIGPNDDAVWNGEPLPTTIVE
jgi:hypothetical protein